jgi:hypothetical protein
MRYGTARRLTRFSYRKEQGTVKSACYAAVIITPVVQPDKRIVTTIQRRLRFTPAPMNHSMFCKTSMFLDTLRVQ